MYGFYSDKHNKIYDLIKAARLQVKCKTLQPVAEYNKGRLKWLELVELFRKATHYVLTQPDYWGWTNIEAATCGALLVVHKTIDKPSSWPSKLAHVTYETQEDLQLILESEVDVKKNRAVALKNTWRDVVLRVLENI